MKRFFVCVYMLLCGMPLVAEESLQSLAGYERRIVVVTCSYNNKEWYKRNLDSVFMQQYHNYMLIYVDDCSPDGTGELVEQYVKLRHKENHVALLKNDVRKGALHNLYRMIHACSPEDIVVIVDGDDCLAHPNVLKRINEVYADPNVWLTYGQFLEYPTAHRGFCEAFPDEIIEQNAFRGHTAQASHLRTFYADLFHKIKLDDLWYDGDFFSMTYDLAIMFPMIEMAAERHKFIDEILYIYNNDNPINDHKVNKDLQRHLDDVIRAMDRYERLDTLFENV